MRFSALGAVLCALLSGCGGGGGSSNDSSVWHFRGINAVADAPNVQFYVADTAVENAEYNAATAYHPAHTGMQAIKLGIKNPSDLSTTDQGYTDIGTSDDFNFQGPTDYTLVATGTVASPRKVLITGTSRDTVKDNIVNYQFVNASSLSDLEVLITAPEAGINAYQSVATLATGAASTATDLTVPAAPGASDTATRSVTFGIQVRRGGAGVYESRSPTVAEQTRQLFVIVDNIGAPHGVPIKILQVSGIDAANAVTLYNFADGSELRFGNLSSDPAVGALDLIVGSNASDVFAHNVAFRALTAYSPIVGSTFNSIATPAGNPGTFLFVNSFSTVAGSSYSLYAQDELANVRGVLLTDDRRSVPNEARFRFLHAATSNDEVSFDIYLVQSGATLDLSATTPPTATISKLGYRTVSTSTALKGGSYDVYFVQAGTKTIILGPQPVALVNGKVQTLALIDSAVGGPLEVLPIDDARP